MLHPGPKHYIHHKRLDEISHHDRLRKSVFTELLSWTEEEGVSKIVGGETNRLVYILLPLDIILFSDSSSVYRMLLIRSRI